MMNDYKPLDSYCDVDAKYIKMVELKERTMNQVIMTHKITY